MTTSTDHTRERAASSERGHRDDPPRHCHCHRHPHPHPSPHHRPPLSHCVCAVRPSGHSSSPLPISPPPLSISVTSSQHHRWLLPRTGYPTDNAHSDPPWPSVDDLNALAARFDASTHPGPFWRLPRGVAGLHLLFHSTAAAAGGAASIEHPLRAIYNTYPRRPRHLKLWLASRRSPTLHTDCLATSLVLLYTHTHTHHAHPKLCCPSSP